MRLFSGRSLATFIPCAAVVLAEFGNEVMDYLAYGMRWADTPSDIANTLFWPLVISLGGAAAADGAARLSASLTRDGTVERFALG